MKIALNEIWNFIDLIDNEEKGWTYGLHASDITVKKISHQTLQNLKSDPEYDTELLPSLFTFREILWQPDVFTEAQMSLPGLRILKAFCDETFEQYVDQSTDVTKVYSTLIKGMGDHCEEAINKIEAEETVIKTLGELRRKSFPIIKFFVYHPQNRIDYYRDAVNRLNYAVKISLTQFFGKYTDLEDPFWEVDYQSKAKAPKKEQEQKKSN